MRSTVRLARRRTTVLAGISLRRTSAWTIAKQCGPPSSARPPTWRPSFAGTTAEVKAALGMSTDPDRRRGRHGDGRRSDRRILEPGRSGFGMTEPVTESVVDEVLAFARDADAKILRVADRAATRTDHGSSCSRSAASEAERQAWVKCAARARGRARRDGDRPAHHAARAHRCPRVRRRHDRGLRDAGRQRPAGVVRLAGRHPRLPDVRRVGRRHPRGHREPVCRERHRHARRAPRRFRSTAAAALSRRSWRFA